MDELKQLNSDLMLHLQPGRQEEPESAPSPFAAPVSKPAKVSPALLF